MYQRKREYVKPYLQQYICIVKSCRNRRHDFYTQMQFHWNKFHRETSIELR